MCFASLFLSIFGGMKKALVIFTFTLLAQLMQGQEAELLNQIREKGKSIQSIEANVHHTKVKDGQTTEQDGTLHYVTPYDMAAIFTTGQHLITNERKLKIDIGMFHGTFRLRDKGIAESLANVFLYAFQGRIQDLADKNNFDVDIASAKDFHTVTVTTRKRRFIGIGFKKAVFKVSASDLCVKEISTTDYKNVVDTYTIHDEKYNVPVDTDRFLF